MKRNQPVKVRVWVAASNRIVVPPRPTSWKTRGLTVMMLTGAIGFVVGGSWIALQLIVNPASVSWLSQFLPDWTIAVAPPQTWPEITAEIRAAEKSIGHPFHFSTYPGLTVNQSGFHDLLLPIVESRPGCKKSICQQITELRVYRPSSRSGFGRIAYDLVDRIAVTGPEELTAIAPLTHSSAVLSGSTRTLPLTQIDLISGHSPEGIWLQLTGEWKRGSVVRYGQLLRYEPNRDRLYKIQAWSSSAGQLPYWQQVTGDSQPELIVDQSIGLEPQLGVYQLRPARTISQAVTLEPISLTEATLKDRTYLNGLLLARHGLWSPALQLLTTVKKRGTWPATAQAQLDLIALNAKITKTQADRDWASPTQQILAQMMDGRWQQALKSLKMAHASGYDIQTLLKSNADRLWPRISAAVRVSPAQGDLQSWGALLVSVRQNRSQAIAWLQRQPDSAAQRSIHQTLALLDSPITAPPERLPSTAIPVSADNTAATASISCLIGSVTPLARVNLQDWQLSKGATLASQSGQTYYQINAIGLCQGNQWLGNQWLGNQWLGNQWQENQRLGSSRQDTVAVKSSSAQPWPSGLAELSLQVVMWQNTQIVQQLPLTIQGFRGANNQFSVLALGKTLPKTAGTVVVAISPQTIAWRQPINSRTLNDLAQAAIWRTQLIPQLWQDLQANNLIPAAIQSSDPLQTIGSWSVQQIELTGDQTPESILTIEPEAAAAPRTIIFSEEGKVVYNDLAQNQSLVAIAAHDRFASPVLLIDGPQGATLQVWSEQTQKFE